MGFQWRLFNVGKSIQMSLFDLNILHSKGYKKFESFFQEEIALSYKIVLTLL